MCKSHIYSLRLMDWDTEAPSHMARCQLGAEAEAHDYGGAGWGAGLQQGLPTPAGPAPSPGQGGAGLPGSSDSPSSVNTQGAERQPQAPSFLGPQQAATLGQAEEAQRHEWTQPGPC